MKIASREERNSGPKKEEEKQESGITRQGVFEATARIQSVPPL